MKTKQLISRSGSFDSMHRVMNEQFKCFNVHGHTYLYELQFEFSTSHLIGYNIDFKEIKRIGSQFIDDLFDHGAILNPQDKVMIAASEAVKSKIWLMSLNGVGNYCNPSVENIAKEVFLAIEYLFEGREGLTLKFIKMYETPNCYTVCKSKSISLNERASFLFANKHLLSQYKKSMGVVEYDDRIVEEDKLSDQIDFDQHMICGPDCTKKDIFVPHIKDIKKITTIDQLYDYVIYYTATPKAIDWFELERTIKKGLKQIKKFTAKTDLEKVLAVVLKFYIDKGRYEESCNLITKYDLDFSKDEEIKRLIGELDNKINK